MISKHRDHQGRRGQGRPAASDSSRNREHRGHSSHSGHAGDYGHDDHDTQVAPPGSTLLDWLLSLAILALGTSLLWVLDPGDLPWAGSGLAGILLAIAGADLLAWAIRRERPSPWDALFLAGGLGLAGWLWLEGWRWRLVGLGALSLGLGLMVVLSPRLRLAWHLTMAGRGDPRSQYRLGEMYYYGDGVPENFQTALRWYTLAANRRYRPATIRINQFSTRFQHDHGGPVPGRPPFPSGPSGNPLPSGGSREPPLPPPTKAPIVSPAARVPVAPGVPGIATAAQTPAGGGPPEGATALAESAGPASGPPEPHAPGYRPAPRPDFTRTGEWKVSRRQRPSRPTGSDDWDVPRPWEEDSRD